MNSDLLSFRFSWDSQRTQLRGILTSKLNWNCKSEGGTCPCRNDNHWPKSKLFILFKKTEWVLRHLDTNCVYLWPPLPRSSPRHQPHSPPSWWKGVRGCQLQFGCTGLGSSCWGWPCPSVWHKWPESKPRPCSCCVSSGPGSQRYIWKILKFLLSRVVFTFVLLFILVGFYVYKLFWLLSQVMSQIQICVPLKLYLLFCWPLGGIAVQQTSNAKLNI